MRRKTVLISDTIAEAIKNFRPASMQAEIWKILMESLFAGTTPDTQDLPDEIHNLFVGINMELRKIQAHWDNGKSQKIFTGEKTGLLGPFDGSEPKRTEANRSEKNGSDYYNNIYNIYNNKYNQYQSINNQSIDFYSEKTRELYFEIMEEVKSIESLPQRTCTQIEKSIRDVATAKESININKTTLEPQVVLEKILSNFENPNGSALAEEINHLFTEMETKKINNRRRYTVASLFNLRIRKQKIEKSNEKHKHFSNERDYTEEELNAVFDDLDSVQF